MFLQPTQHFPLYFQTIPLVTSLTLRAKVADELMRIALSERVEEGIPIELTFVQELDPPRPALVFDGVGGGGSSVVSSNS